MHLRAHLPEVARSPDAPGVQGRLPLRPAQRLHAQGATITQAACQLQELRRQQLLLHGAPEQGHEVGEVGAALRGLHGAGDEPQHPGEADLDVRLRQQLVGGELRQGIEHQAALPCHF